MQKSEKVNLAPQNPHKVRHGARVANCAKVKIHGYHEELCHIVQNLTGCQFSIGGIYCCLDK